MPRSGEQRQKAYEGFGGGGPNPGAPKAVRHVGNGNCTVYGPLFSRMTQKSAKALRKARVRSLTINH